MQLRSFGCMDLVHFSASCPPNSVQFSLLLCLFIKTGIILKEMWCTCVFVIILCINEGKNFQLSQI